MTSYSRTASQFLASTFTPYGGGGHDESDQAPLFFSTVDGASETSVAQEYDDEHGIYQDSSRQGGSRYGRAQSSAGQDDPYHQHRQHADSSTIDEEEQEGMEQAESIHESSSYSPNDPYHHDGLGRTPSDAGSDATSDDPFRSNGTRSRQSASTAPSRAAAAHRTQTTPGWKMHATNLLPNVKQSVLHNLYEQSESVYSSVFIGNKQDKGKQRAVDNQDLDNDIAATTNRKLNQSKLLSSPPDFLAGPAVTALPLHRSGSPKRAVNVNPHLSIHEQYDVTQAASDSTEPRIHRYPMPTSRYRRLAAGMKLASGNAGDSDTEWQDQSYRDPAWLAIYLFNLLFTTLLGLYLFLFDSTPKPAGLPSSSHLIAPSMAILRSIPLLSLLVFASLLITVSTLAYTLLIKNGARQAAFAFILAPPIVFLTGAGWAFEASFAMDYDDVAGISTASEWAQTTLRITSLVLLIAAALAFRRSWSTVFSSGSSSRRARLERTIRVLQVSAEVIMQHPQLILLAIGLVGAYIISSVPAILVIAQLLYHGILVKGQASSAGSQYSYLIPSTGSVLLSLHTTFVYFWTLGLLRAVYQHTIAGTVGSWWYNEKSTNPSHKENSTDKQAQQAKGEPNAQKLSLSQSRKNVLDSLHRAVGPSLGTLCASSLILAILSLFTLLITLCYSLVNRSRRWSGPNLAATLLRTFVSFIILPFIAILGGIIRNLNAFTLIHSAITGDRFWDASGEAMDLIMGRNGTDMVASHLMIRSLLSIFSLALAVLGGLAGYVSSVYWLSAPSAFPSEDAKEVTMLTPLLVAFVCGIVPFWTVRFSSDLLSNAVDATFVCFNIDLDIGQSNHKEVYEAFAYEESEDSLDYDDDDGLMGMAGMYDSRSSEAV